MTESFVIDATRLDSKTIFVMPDARRFSCAAQTSRMALSREIPFAK